MKILGIEWSDPLSEQQFNQLIKKQITENQHRYDTFEAATFIKKNGYPDYFVELKKLKDSGLECINPDVKHQNKLLEQAIDNLFEKNFNLGFTIYEIQKELKK